MLFAQPKATSYTMSSRVRKTIRRCLSGLILLPVMIVSLTLKAEDLENTFVDGTDFSKLVMAHLQNKTDLDQLESISNIEIFYWYGCESCYQVELALQQYLDRHPEVTLRRTPLIARPSWRFQANLQAIMEQLSGEVQTVPSNQIYQACLPDCQKFNSYDNNKAWLAESMQLSEFPVLDMSRLWNTEKNYQKRADLFSITQVPTIIINETFKIDANQAKTPVRMVEIADHLLSSAAR